MRKILLVISLFFAISCSTTKLLPEGTYRLASQKVDLTTRNKELSASSFSQYIRQQPNSSIVFNWSPSLSIYNWSDGSGRGINGFWERMGQAPVVFDPTLIPSSQENIAGRLETLGYYDSKVRTDVEYKGRLAHVDYHIPARLRLLFPVQLACQRLTRPPSIR